jgi:hypothetical protein
MDNIIQFKANITETATIQMLDNEEHLVVPVVAAIETVMNRLLYTKNEMQKSIQGWNGVPITVGHPETDEGYASANSPSMLEKFGIGKFFNVKYDDGIKGEIWINLKNAMKKGFNQIISKLEQGEMMEVSTGLLCEVMETKGVFNSREYDGMAVNILPDHLAVLPNEKGACSIQDGCGAMRTNCEGSCTCKSKNDSHKIVETLTNFFNETSQTEPKKQEDSMESNEETSIEQAPEAEAPEEVAEPVVNKAEAVETKEEVAEPVVNKAESVESILESIQNAEIKTLLANAVKEQNEKREAVISKIISNSEIKKDEISKLEINTLEKIATLAEPKKESAYIGSGAVGVVNQEETHQPPSILL